MASHKMKEAASVMILSKASSAARLCATPGLPHAKQILEDYSVLLLKRSSRSRFMPSACVFPGGTWDAADASSPWLQVFSSCGVSPENLHQHFRLSDSVRAPLYSRLAEKMALAPQPTTGWSSAAFGPQPPPGSVERLIPEVALRITALRETFEETGLLLAVPVRDGVRQTPLAITDKETFRITSQGAEDLDFSDEDRFLGDWLAAKSGRSLSQWREQVQKKPSKFVDLFASSCSPSAGDGGGLLPWLWGLVEWWSWLTPTTFPAKRYDTMFYTALLHNVAFAPEMFSHCNESDDLMVAAPSVITQEWLAGNGWLAPPQVYELGRLSWFTKLEEVQQHVTGRVGQGVAAAAVDTWLPQVYTADDGVLSVLPGDVLYSRSYCGTADDMPVLAGTMQRQRKRPTIGDEAGGDATECTKDTDKHVPLNRMEMSCSNVCTLVVNVEPKYGQVVPVDLVQRFSDTFKESGSSPKIDSKSSL